jgi:hypothetical protein
MPVAVSTAATSCTTGTAAANSTRQAMVMASAAAKGSVLQAFWQAIVM